MNLFLNMLIIQTIACKNSLVVVYKQILINITTDKWLNYATKAFTKSFFNFWQNYWIRSVKAIINIQIINNCLSLRIEIYWRWTFCSTIFISLRKITFKIIWVLKPLISAYKCFNRFSTLDLVKWGWIVGYLKSNTSTLKLLA